MTNQLMTQRPSLSELAFAGLDWFPETVLNRFMGAPFGQPNVMRQYQKDDGSKVVEYNLAGFDEKEILVNVDTALNELIIKAERSEDGNSRRFMTSLSLSPYTSPEDVGVSYKNGVLVVEVAPLEKRKEEALISLPLNKATDGGSQKTIGSGEDNSS